MNKMCSKCQQIKDISDFAFRNRGKGLYQNWCKICTAAYKQEYYLKNKAVLLAERKQYRLDHLNEEKARLKRHYTENRAGLLQYQKKYYVQNQQEKLVYATEYRNDSANVDRIATYQREYRAKNRSELLAYIQKYQDENRDRLNAHRNQRKKDDPIFRLRTLVSSNIATALKKQGSSKGGISCMKSLDYSIGDLKEHLETLFEPWMNWDNYGQYDANTWNDGDQSTWRWNIDHIIPRADLPYDSMEHENFKKCWVLKNLRPYSAKQNMIDGITKVRHEQGNKRG